MNFNGTEPTCCNTIFLFFIFPFLHCMAIIKCNSNGLIITLINNHSQLSSLQNLKSCTNKSQLEVNKIKRYFSFIIAGRDSYSSLSVIRISVPFCVRLIVICFCLGSPNIVWDIFTNYKHMLQNTARKGEQHTICIPNFTTV